MAAQQKGVDVDIVKKVFPYGKIDDPKIVKGGLRWHSGIIIPELDASWERTNNNCSACPLSLTTNRSSCAHQFACICGVEIFFLWEAGKLLPW